MVLPSSLPYLDSLTVDTFLLDEGLLPLLQLADRSRERNEAVAMMVVVMVVAVAVVMVVKGAGGCMPTPGQF